MSGYFPMVLLAVVLSAVGPEAHASCQEGQTILNGACVYKNICPDGRPFVNGKCLDRCWDGSRFDSKSCRGLGRWADEPGGEFPTDRIQNGGDSDDESVPVVRDCEKSTVFYEGGKDKTGERKSPSGRSVILVNGVGRNLFVRYVRDLHKSGKGIRLSELTVACFQRDKSKRSFSGSEATFGEALAGVTEEAKWKRILGQIECIDLENAERIATHNSSDLICGSRAEN